MRRFTYILAFAFILASCQGYPLGPIEVKLSDKNVLLTKRGDEIRYRTNVVPKSNLSDDNSECTVKVTSDIRTINSWYIRPAPGMAVVVEVLNKPVKIQSDEYTLTLKRDEPFDTIVVTEKSGKSFLEKVCGLNLPPANPVQ